MTNIDLKKLIQHLDVHSQKALEAAIAQCVKYGHATVENEHWLLTILQNNFDSVTALLAGQEINLDKLEQELLREIERFNKGSTRTPSLSMSLVKVAHSAWLLASLEFNHAQINIGHVLYAMLEQGDWNQRLQPTLTELVKIDADKLKQTLQNFSSSTAANSAELSPNNTPKNQQVLAQYTNDLTALAAAGKIDPVIGRETEIRQMIDILSRRRQNNPILTGEAGVGKTAIVEGLALRLVAKDVPPNLLNSKLLSLDLAALQAGAGVKGEFEQRLKDVLTAIQAAETPVILFIDEAHTLIGAGGQAGQGDAANLLKPALARGELRTIAATTWAEYKKYIENDAALTRRFQVVKVDEPSEENAIAMLTALLPTLEQHHGVRILTAGLEAAVKLSKRFLPNRKLPDKAVSLLDTACARVKLSQTAQPLDLINLQRQADLLEQKIQLLEREYLVDKQQDKKIIQQQKNTLAETKAQLQDLTARWTDERALTKTVHDYKMQLENAQTDLKETRKLYKQLQVSTSELNKLQGENSLVHGEVDTQAIATIIAEWTGIPVGRMLSDEIKTSLSLREQLEQKILGQQLVLDILAKQLQVAHANLHDPNKPRGVFLLVGSSGVGKTETALALAELLFGDKRHLTVINMSEFKEPHKVSMLTGTSAGYVGYGEGGILTEAVKRKPYSVILLDEMEKAHPSVQELFYQVFDKGMLMDGEGQIVDFKNTIIMMASNAGASTLLNLSEANEKLNYDEIIAALQPELGQHFKPAFLGRVSLLPYLPLKPNIIVGIIKQKLQQAADRLVNHYQATLVYEDNILNYMVEHCTQSALGARTIDRLLNMEILPKIASECLSAKLTNKKFKKISLELDSDKQWKVVMLN